MVSGYERKFTAAGAEIAEETQRVNQNLSSLSAFAPRSLRLCGESALFTGVLKALIAHNFNLHTVGVLMFGADLRVRCMVSLCPVLAKSNQVT